MRLVSVVSSVGFHSAGGPSARALLASLRSTTTIAAVLLVSLVFVLGLVTFLSYFKFESSLATIAERRIALIVERAQGSIETAMHIGLRLEDIEAVGAVVDEARRQDSRIEDIHVFDTDGARNVFASDPSKIGAAVDPSWLKAQTISADGSWRVQSGGQAMVGHRLDSSIAKGVGGIVVVYSLADVFARIETMRGKLIRAALGILALFSVLALVGALFVTTGFRRMIGDLADGIAAPDEPGASPEAPLPDSLRASVEQFREAATEAGLHLDRLEADLSRPPDTETRRMAALA